MPRLVKIHPASRDAKAPATVPFQALSELEMIVIKVMRSINLRPETAAERLITPTARELAWQAECRSRGIGPAVAPPRSSRRRGGGPADDREVR